MYQIRIKTDKSGYSLHETDPDVAVAMMEAAANGGSSGVLMSNGKPLITFGDCSKEWLEV